jgi:predicted metalloprotease
MRWDDFRRSDNVEDVRGDGGFGGGGGGFSLPGGGGGLGIGTIIVLGLLAWALGIDPRILIGGAEVFTGGPGQSRMERQAPPSKTGAPTDQQGQFVAAVLGSTEDVWSDIFRANGQTYRPPRLRLYSGATSGGACGMAQSAMGPFYCPPDKRVFLDTSFFRDMEQKFRACTGKQCEFAQAYVMAHEIGHHVQNQLGILPRAMQLQQTAGSKAQANNIQVRVELQADCLAGVWANHAQRKKAFIDPGDVEGAISIATAIGDDRLQKQATGRVVPDSFTHGSSEQRVRWFKTGFESGRVSACDTFRSANL